MPRAKKQRKRTYGTGSVYQQKGRLTFSVQWREDGKKRQSHGHATREIAEQVLARINAGLVHETTGVPLKSLTTAVAPTLGGLMEDWLASREGTHASTPDDRNRWKNHLKKDFGRLRLADVDTKRLRDLITAKLEEGLAPSTVGLLLKLLGSFFTDQKEDGHVGHNPVHSLPKKVKRLVKSTHDPSTTPYLKTREDIVALYARLPEAVNVAFAIGALAGLRTGEVLGLDWSHIDLATRKMNVREQVSRGRIKGLKDKEARIVPVGDALVPILEAWQRRTGGVGRLFLARKATGCVYRTPKSDRTWTVQWRDKNDQIRTKSGFGCQKEALAALDEMSRFLPLHPLARGTTRKDGGPRFLDYTTLHNFLDEAQLQLFGTVRLTWYQATRHTFASQWVLHGGSIQRLQLIMGHASVTTTERYAHLAPGFFSDEDLARMGEGTMLTGEKVLASQLAHKMARGAVRTARREAAALSSGYKKGEIDSQLAHASVSGEKGKSSKFAKSFS